jgi:peptide deformylase
MVAAEGVGIAAPEVADSSVVAVVAIGEAGACAGSSVGLRDEVDTETIVAVGDGTGRGAVCAPPAKW